MHWLSPGGTAERPADENARIAIVRRFDVLEPGHRAAFDRIARLAAHTLGVPSAGVSLVDTDRIRFIGAHRVPVDGVDRRSDSFCEQVVNRAEVVVIRDATADPTYQEQPLVAGDGALPDGPVRFYVGAPIWIGSEVVGSLWGFDHAPRSTPSDDDLDALRDLAELTARELESLVNQRHLRDLYDHAQDAVFTLWPDGTFASLNPAFERITGHPREDWLGRTFDELVHPADLPQVTAAFEQALSGEVVRLDLRIVSPDGDTRPVDVMAVPRRVDGGTHQVFGFARDIRERQEAHERLQEQADLLRDRQDTIRKMARASSDALWDYDAESGTLWWSAGFEDLFGYPNESFQATPDRWEERIHPDDYERIMAGHGVALEEQRDRWTDEYRYRRADGTYAHVIDRAFIEYDDEGELVQMYGGMVDITGRKETELALQRSEELFRDLYAQAPIGIYRTTPKGEILLANDALVRMLGFASFDELRHRDLEAEGYDRDTPRSDFRARIDHQSKVEGFEAIWRKKDGSPLVVREYARAIRDEYGDVMYYEGTVEDVTEQRRFESALRHLVEVPSSSDERDLQHLVDVLAEALEMPWSLFVRPTVDGNIEVIASHGADVPARISSCTPLVSASQGNPTELLAGLEIHFDGCDDLLAIVPAKAMLAVPVHNSVGEPIGALAVLHDRPIQRPTPSDRWLLTAFAQRAGGDLEQLEHLNRLEATARAADVLRSAETADEVFERASAEMLATTAARSVTIYQLEAHGEELVVQHVAGRAAVERRFERLSRGEGITWRAVESAASVFIPDVSKDSDTVFFSGRQERGAFVAAPLMDPKGRITGVLAADTEGPGGLTNLSRLDQYYVEAMAQAIGVSVARIRALEQAKQDSERFRLLAGLSSQLELIDDPIEIAQTALESLLPLSGFDFGSMWLTEGTELRRVLTVGTKPEGVERVFADRDLSTRGGILGSVVERREMMWVPDYPTHPLALPEYVHVGLRSLLVVPLLQDEEVSGLIALDSFVDVLEDRSETRSLLTSVAHRVQRAWQRASVRRELLATREEALRAFGLALEYRDYETKGHTDRVSELALGLGASMGLGPDALQDLRWGAYLHDAGKVSIPDHILLKPGKLDAAEWRRMQEHVTIGETMLQSLGFIPDSVLALVRHHHERFDGAGYPDGIAGHDIPLQARLFAVVDVYDALTSERPYKVAWLHEEAMAEIVSQAGHQFDPDVVDAFVAFMQARNTPS